MGRISLDLKDQHGRILRLPVGVLPSVDSEGGGEGIVCTPTALSFIAICSPTAVSFVAESAPTAVSFIAESSPTAVSFSITDNDGDGGGRTLVAYWSSSDAMQQNEIASTSVVHIPDSGQVQVPISKKYTGNIREQLAYLDQIATSIHTPPLQDGFGFTAKFKGLSRSFGYAINVMYPNTQRYSRIPVKTLSKMDGDRYVPNYTLPDYAFCPAEGDPSVGIHSKDANGLSIYPGILSIAGYPVGNSFIANSTASRFSSYTTIETDGVVEGGVPSDWGIDYIVLGTEEYTDSYGRKVVKYNCLIGDMAYNACQNIYHEMDKISLLEESISNELLYFAETESTYPKLDNFDFATSPTLPYSDFAGVHFCYSVAVVYEVNATSGDYTELTAKSLAANVVHFVLYPTFLEV